MFLSKVEVYGFKSFANKETFDFSEGITGFVGPNGCGKSNVVDAIKWGLGEQRVSTLRGDSMQDVIFKGNGRRPPMNFAEVSLYFSNEDGSLAIEYDEVVITRRLYRSGESEYLINRTPCRLKDIRHLFLDTGIGVNAYSMMEQGKIDSILQTDAVSRRAIFEEASGISRFKARRREAERKLERTRANLLRAGDIIEELEKRIRSLKNQAGRARSYLKNSERLKELKQDYFLFQYRHLMSEASEIEARKVEAQEEADLQHRALMDGKEEVARLEKEIEFNGEELLSKKTELTEAKTSLEETQGRIGYFEKRSLELERERAEAVEREGELTVDLARKEEEFTEIRERLAQLKREELEIAQEDSRYAEREAQSEAVWKEALERMKSLEDRSFDLARQEVDLKNRTVETEAGFKAVTMGLARLARRQNEMAGELFVVTRGLSGVETRLEEKERARADLLASLREGQQKASRAEDGLQAIDGDLKRIEGEVIKRESRMDVLQTLLDRREGVGSGVKSVLQEAGREASPLHFVKGMLGELVEVDVDHSAALEAALGANSEALVVEDQEQARAVMEFLSRERRGRVTLLVLRTFDEVPSQAAKDQQHLLHHVVCRDPVLEKAVDALLGNVRIVERGALTEGLDRDGSLVTLQGDFLDRSGLLSVGGTVPEPGVISRRSELAALAAEKEALVAQCETLLGKRKTTEAEVLEVRSANQEISGRIEQETDALSAIKGEREKHYERWSHLRREYTLNVFDFGEMEVGSRAQKRELTALVHTMGQIRDDAEALRQQLRAGRETVQASGAEKEQLTLKRRELEFQRIKFLERREGMEKELHLVETHLEEVKQRLKEMVHTSERLASMKADMELQVEEMKGRVGTLVEKRSLLSDAVTELETVLQRIREVFDSSRTGMEQIEAALEEARSKVDELRIEERGNQVKREGLIEKAREELELDLSGDTVDALTEDRDWDAVESEITEIRERLARMGNVNLDAIDELKEVEDRHVALQNQSEDLTKSIKSLEDLIADLNRESREKFMETFESVRGHFNEIFRKLFQGGRADVRLREGEDILEAGIEIIAGPPGKDVRSISLLSGGERTLTATGLLFALFKSRPSPFCILDEVDAALDETNIERFCNLLGEFVNDSQFIIITHSKRTMSYCDYLYGITMQEDGVTTHISLNLEAYEDQVA